MLGLGVSIPQIAVRRSAAAATPAYQQILDAVSAVDANASVWNPDDSSTLTSRESGGSTFASQVDDGLGNRESLVMATESRQPLLRELSTGRLVWVGDGSSDYFMLADFASAIAQPLTVFVVGRRSGVSQFFFDGSQATGGRIIMGRDAGNNGDIWAGSWLTASADASVALEMWQGNYDGASSEVFKGATSIQTGNPGANGMGGFGILQAGNNTIRLNGDLALVAVFPTKRTNAELAGLRAIIEAQYPIGATS